MRFIKPALAVLAFSVCLVGGSVLSRAENFAVPERVIGKKDAPVTLQEFASLTCSHCSKFYETILPELQKKYIDTGKVRFILRDFPLDGVALRAAALARCMPVEQFYPFIGVLYKNLGTWAVADNPMKSLQQYAKLGGLSDEKAKACVEDTKMLDALVAGRTAATEKYGVEATPSFIINDGQKIVGDRSLKEFTDAIDKALEKPQAPAK
ncbi:MAG: DsbA family protein [Alphaproteobacteria bacterium]|nr:DsbA family protein [Alphaproteobacteria bacterium]